MKLQILIPQYKETEDVIRPLLTSIALQQNVDFNEIGVIITNDGSDTILSEDFLNSFPYKIDYYKAPHQGVSATRNYCLDKATADYVMFCDADDMFYNMCGLFLIFKEITIGFEVLLSFFTEETRDQNGNPVYVDHKQDATFVHGKTYNRDFLIRNNIRWKDQFTIHEDSYFNYLCQACATEGQMKLCQYPFYLWKWNDNSVSRHDPKYILKTFNCLLDSSTQLIRDLSERGLMKNAQTIATSIIFDSYFTLNKKEWLEQENQDYRDNVERRFKQFYLEFKDYYEALDEQTKNSIIIQQKNKKYSEGMIMESITFNDWIKVILNK